MAQRDRTLTLIAYGCAAAGMACLASAVVWHLWMDDHVPLLPLDPGNLAFGLVWPILGCLVVHAAPRNLVGWLLILPATLGPYELLAHYAVWSVAMVGQPLPGTVIAAWIGTWGFTPAYFFAVPILALVFPTGQVPDGLMRQLLMTFLAAAVAFTALGMLLRVPLDLSDTVVNPFGVIPLQSWTRGVSYGLSLFLLAGGPLAGMASLLTRARRTVGAERAQLLWLLFGFLVLALSVLVASVLELRAGQYFAADLAFAFALVSPAAAIAIAMLKHGLYDIAYLLNRSLAYLMLTGLVIGAYLGMVLWIGRYTASPTVTSLFVAALALAAAAARDAIQRGVDVLLFGHRRDPTTVLATVGRHVSAAAEPLDALHRMVDGARQALRLPYAAFAGRVVVECGHPVAGWHTVPARALGQTFGELRVGRRHRAERWSATERASATEIAGRAATLAYAATLVTQVATSRARIVIAREEERRAVASHLHDNIGPTLAGAAHQLDALVRQIEEIDQPAGRKVADIRDRIRRTVGEVRTLAHGLRPAALDQLGFVDAISELAAGYDAPKCFVTIAGRIDALPAAVEVAAYAITNEAIANAVRHSAARVIRVAVTTKRPGMEQAPALQIEVTDDGCGLPAKIRTGLGLRSMGDRAAEVGGTLDLVANPGGGTTVRAYLPLDQS